MTALSQSTVETLLTLRNELAQTIQCHFCGQILHNARTLNCPHHVCEACAKEQHKNQNGACQECQCSYYPRDITDNRCINNIVDTFYHLSATIERAAELLGVANERTYGVPPAHANAVDSEIDSLPDTILDLADDHDVAADDDQDTNKKNTRTKNRKRKLSDPLYIMDTTEAKKMKLSTVDGNDNMDSVVATDDDQDSASTIMDVDLAYMVPKHICLTGADKETIAKFTRYANSFGMQLSKKWSLGTTDMLLCKANMIDNQPSMTFKVLASILCDIPVVKDLFLEHSYEQQKVLDFKEYVCNYRRVGNQALFEGLHILFATTDMAPDRLRMLLALGKAKILESVEQINDKDRSNFNQRIMICSHEIERWQAKKLSAEYNCRVISETWVIQCILPGGDSQENTCLIKKPSQPIVNQYFEEPVMERLGLDEYDQTLKDDGSSDDDDDDDDNEESD